MFNRNISAVLIVRECWKNKKYGIIEYEFERFKNISKKSNIMHLDRNASLTS